MTRGALTAAVDAVYVHIDMDVLDPQGVSRQAALNLIEGAMRGGPAALNPEGVIGVWSQRWECSRRH